MKKRIFCLFTACLLVFSGCSPFLKSETPLSKEEAKNVAITCLNEHKEDMEAILSFGKAMGETDWCYVYNRLGENRYEFVLQQTGFTGTNIKTGIRYIPDDTPDGRYTQDGDNNNLYSFCGDNDCDEYFLERIEQKWFFFYDTYDF